MSENIIFTQLDNLKDRYELKKNLNPVRDSAEEQGEET
jgi:hypothetical protein